MKFEQVLVELKNGKRAFRENVEYFDWIYLSDSEFCVMWDDGLFYNADFYKLTTEDILAEDWIVLED